MIEVPGFKKKKALRPTPHPVIEGIDEQEVI